MLPFIILGFDILCSCGAAESTCHVKNGSATKGAATEGDSAPVLLQFITKRSRVVDNQTSKSSECMSWCQSDYDSGKNQGRHCAPGNMAHLCGGCSFCPTPAPPTTAPTPSEPCESWCESIHTGCNNGGRLCGTGDMAHLCGGCSFCEDETPAPTPAPPATTPTPTPSSEPCESWCESDHASGKNQGRHCGNGDMAHFCGRCSFCKDTISNYTGLCASKVPMSSDSVWRQLWSHPSCRGPFKSEGFSMCEGDRTSISLDMTQVASKRGCYVYGTSSNLNFDSHQLRKLEFDAEWDSCQNVWMAPLWLVPARWIAPQGTSGEIDLLETCRSHAHDTVGTSIICRDHPHPGCFEPQWGQAASSGGPLHFVATIDNKGTWSMKKYSHPYDENSKGELISRYPYFLQTNKGSQQHMKFHFMSDLWNGGGGDAGWRACGTMNWHTQCRYTIANIKLEHK